MTTLAWGILVAHGPGITGRRWDHLVALSSLSITKAGPFSSAERYISPAAVRQARAGQPQIGLPLLEATQQITLGYFGGAGPENTGRRWEHLVALSSVNIIKVGSFSGAHHHIPRF